MQACIYLIFYITLTLTYVYIQYIFIIQVIMPSENLNMKLYQVWHYNYHTYYKNISLGLSSYKMYVHGEQGAKELFQVTFKTIFR